MRILKFGGGCLRDAASCRRVTAVVQRARRDGDIVVVVSALYGVTNRLIDVVATAADGQRAQAKKILHALRADHETIAKQVMPATAQRACVPRLHQLFAELDELIEGVVRLQECSPRTKDRCIGYGELLSSTIVAAMLQTSKLRARAVDARTCIVSDDQFGNATVDLDATRKKLQAAQREWRGVVPVVTGFIAATADGIPTTVGRNGSDYTAALLGALLKAKAIELWHDVDGIMSADPSVVPDAFPLQSLTYAEAMEMAYFGAKVLHPRAVIPAINAKIPLFLRNIFRPEWDGTRVAAHALPGDTVVKGITAIRHMSLLSLEGAGMIGVNGVAARLFGALAQAGINVTLISQGSSEQSICCVVQRADAEVASRVVREAFHEEFQRQLIRRIECRNDIVVVAVVGGGMRGTPGIAAKLFGALGKNKINVIAVAQGSSELNISLVVHEADCPKALNVIHGAFHLAARHVHVVVIGKGTIGSKLLEQIAAGQERLAHDRDLRLHVVGIADRSRVLFRPEGIALKQWRKALPTGRPLALDTIAQHILESRLANLIFVDVTASEAVARQYPAWLSQGISVVTPNKKANTLAQDFYDSLATAVRRRNSYYLYETCVGAGLPVISTLHDLIDSGDHILHIEAALSGTLGYLFSELEQGKPFSAVVRAAHTLGYTEPDPRDDLSGMDVARKLLILARTMGARLSLSQVKVEPLLPATLQKGGSVEQFFKKLSSVDAMYAQHVAAAAKQGKTLRYIGRVQGNRCAVKLQAVPKDSPFGSLRGGDNLVVFTTERYRTNPLIVRGPGAGPDVTAGGVFADILKVATLLTT